MILFNPENKERLTYGKTLAPAMNITEQADVNQYLSAYVKWLKKKFPNIPEPKLEQNARFNLNYYGGYYSDTTQKRVTQLFTISEEFPQ